MIPILALMDLCASGTWDPLADNSQNPSDNSLDNTAIMLLFLNTVPTYTNNLYAGGVQMGGQALYGNPGAGVKMIVVSSGQLAGTNSKPVGRRTSSTVTDNVYDNKCTLYHCAGSETLWYRAVLMYIDLDPTSWYNKLYVDIFKIHKCWTRRASSVVEPTLFYNSDTPRLCL